MGELAELVLMNHPTLTKTIDRMVSGGFVHRRADGADNRRVIVYITDRGLGLITRLRECVDQHHEAISAAVGAKKAEQLKKLLGELIRNTDIGRAPFRRTSARSLFFRRATRDAAATKAERRSTDPLWR